MQQIPPYFLVWTLKIEVSVHLPTIDTNNAKVNVESQKLLAIVKYIKRVVTSELPKRLIN
jgi:hypothetical protein